MDYSQHEHIHQSQAATMEHNEMDAMGAMKMYLHFGLGDLFLFRGFVIDSTARLVLTCVLVFIGALLLEAIDYTRGYLSCWCHEPPASNQGRAHSVSSQSALVVGSEQQAACVAPGELADIGVQRAEKRCCDRSRAAQEKGPFVPPLGSALLPPIKIRLLQAALHFVRTGIALGLMLVAMTYNVCLIFPIMLGASLGFLVFHRSGSDVTGVCH